MLIQLTSVVSVLVKAKEIARLPKKFVVFHLNFHGLLSFLGAVIESITTIIHRLSLIGITFSSFTSSRGRESSRCQVPRMKIGSKGMDLPF